MPMTHNTFTKRGGAGDRFGDYLSVDCANLPCVSGHNQFTNTKLTRPITKISKSSRSIENVSAPPGYESNEQGRPSFGARAR